MMYVAERFMVSTGERHGKPIIVGDFTVGFNASREWAHMLNLRLKGSPWFAAGGTVISEHKRERFEWRIREAGTDGGKA